MLLYIVISGLFTGNMFFVLPTHQHNYTGLVYLCNQTNTAQLYFILIFYTD